MVKLVSAIALAATAAVALAEGLPSRQEIRATMRRVADWQIVHQPQVRWGATNWTNGALYVGMLDWGALAEAEEKDRAYTLWVEGIGEGCGWQPAAVRKGAGKNSHADDFTVCQAWLRQYQRLGGKGRLEPTLKRLDGILKNPPKCKLVEQKNWWGTLVRWSWCDALYMAPQVWAQMWRITGERKYLDYMDQEFRATTEALYDKEERLFYRDCRYFPDAPENGYAHREANGAKVFWGRGNGWVVAGLANLLRILPKDAPNRAYYEGLFKELAGRLATLQCADGYWRASLLDPESYPSPETSGTGFIVYGLAWGVNEGLLDRAATLPVIEKGWAALCKAVEQDGKLGYVQPIGQDPKKVTREMTEVYGVGAFLQAGAQVHRLAR